MKRAALFHGTGNTTKDAWYPWMIETLKRAGYEVYAPLLPDNRAPNKDTYEKFLHGSEWDFSNNVLVGHSSGATTILNLLFTDWFPRVEAVVLVGTFLNEKLTKSATWYTSGQFDNLFLPDYLPEVLQAKVGKFYFVHGDDDPYCDINDAKSLCAQLGGTFMTVPDGHHLGASSGRTELPELLDVLRRDGIV